MLKQKWWRLLLIGLVGVLMLVACGGEAGLEDEETFEVGDGLSVEVDEGADEVAVDEGAEEMGGEDDELLDGEMGDDAGVGLTAVTCSGPFDVSENEDPVSFEVEGEIAIMSGVIDSDLPDQIDDLLYDHPEVTTIVMTYVPGSDDDQANLEGSLMIFEAGLATCVPSGGLIASGGVDFFLAGRTRSAAEDAYVGVHSWAAGDGLEGGDLPEDDPEHDAYLDYYNEIGIDEDFYWFTLEAAPADGMHNMSAEEREEWAVNTE
ncbi:MAG TPA: hypothetical protein VLL52_24490 [Anaerolineae bacterium]|nr:hypothetical protein [Anaerolineae bacterium]